MKTACAQSLKWTLSAGFGEAVEERTRNTHCTESICIRWWNEITFNGSYMQRTLHPLNWRGIWRNTGLFSFFPLSCLEMASDVSSLGAGVSSGNPGQAQAGGGIVQRANKRRPGWVCALYLCGFYFLRGRCVCEVYFWGSIALFQELSALWWGNLSTSKQRSFLVPSGVLYPVFLLCSGMLYANHTR